MGKDELTDEQADKLAESDSEMLTPWQQANIDYLKEQGLTSAEVSEDQEQSEDNEEQENVDQASEPMEEEQEKETKEAEDVEGSLKTAKDLPKSKSFADKLPKMKEARQKRLKKRLTLLVSIFGVTALGMIYYVSPLSKLNKIEIVGNQAVSKTAIAEATGLSSDDMIWSAYFNKQVIPKIKEKNPRINTVSVKLSQINNLKYTVTEFSEVAYAKDNEVFHPVLENGAILAETTTAENENFPILIDFEEGESLDSLMTHFKDVDSEIKNNIKEIRSTPTDHNKYLMRIFMKDENEIVASTKDFYDKINFYPEIVADMDAKGVIDMEAGVYWKSFETIEKEIAEEKAKKDYDEWVKSLEEENNEKNN